jgi:hypothetical protein
MKALSRMTILAGLAALAALAAPGAKAQSEIAPDSFDSPNTVPLEQSKGMVVNMADSPRHEHTLIAAHNVQGNTKEPSARVYAAAVIADRRPQPTAGRPPQVTGAEGGSSRKDSDNKPE